MTDNYNPFSQENLSDIDSEQWRRAMALQAAATVLVPVWDKIKGPILWRDIALDTIAVAAVLESYIATGKGRN
jgi:hypothetical protein